MRTRIKFCGITRPDDAQQASQLGVDAIGLVFYEPSPRAVTLDQAQAIVAELPPFVAVVALFVDAERDYVEQVIRTVNPDILQFHGDENVDYCTSFGRPFYKAIRMKKDVDLVACATEYAQARALLLDTYQAGVAGGTGQAFDWSRVPAQGIGLPLILAGGLDADNVYEAVNIVRPYAVDVSGGIEIEKGIKDAAKMAAFVRGVNRADRNE